MRLTQLFDHATAGLVVQLFRVEQGQTVQPVAFEGPAQRIVYFERAVWLRIIRLVEIPTQPARLAVLIGIGGRLPDVHRPEV